MDLLSLVVGALLSAIPTIIVALIQYRQNRRDRIKLNEKIEALINVVYDLKGKYDNEKINSIEREGKILSVEEKTKISQSSTKSIIQKAPALREYFEEPIINNGSYTISEDIKNVSE
jgi:hypothetical protein